MPVTPQSIAAFQRLVRLFARMAWLGGAFILGGIVAGIIAQGVTRVALPAALCSSGALMMVVGLREWRKGNQKVLDMRGRINGHADKELL